MTDEQQLLDLIANNREAILAAVRSDGYPHLTNVLYVWDAERRIARVSTTADRVKGRILQRDSHAALHVSGPAPRFFPRQWLRAGNGIRFASTPRLSPGRSRSSRGY